MVGYMGLPWAGPGRRRPAMAGNGRSRPAMAIVYQYRIPGCHPPDPPPRVQALRSRAQGPTQANKTKQAKTKHGGSESIRVQVLGDIVAVEFSFVFRKQIWDRFLGPAPSPGTGPWSEATEHRGIIADHTRIPFEKV